MVWNRSIVCGLRLYWLAALLVVLGAVPALAESVTLRDIRGREVSLPHPAGRIVIDDGRYLVALGLLHADPVRLLAGWPRDINRLGRENYTRYVEKFPALAQVPQSPSSAGSFALEPILAAAPDVAIFTLGTGPSDEQVRQLERVGIPVVFIDFFSHPFRNLDASLRILGKLTGAEDRAEAFVAFRQEHLKRVAERTAGLDPKQRPLVFLEAHAGMTSDCCNSPGKGNIGDYIELAGGHNIGADVLDRAAGRLNMEYVISRAPQIYIATGGPHLERSGGLVLGGGYSADKARASLAHVAARPGIASLGAVAAGNVHGLSHQLINSPVDVLAVEVLAKWIHPDLFRDLDPAGTMREINSRFLAVPLDGTYWTDVR